MSVTRLGCDRAVLNANFDFCGGTVEIRPRKGSCGPLSRASRKTGPAIGLEFSRVIEVAESRASNAETRKREEAAMLEKHLADGAALVLLDERGKALDSPAFAEFLVTCATAVGVI